MGIDSRNMFSLKYQMFLNDMYYWGTTDILSYSMAQRLSGDTELPPEYSQSESDSIRDRIDYILMYHMMT